MSYKISKIKKGFTFIELLVVLAIAVIMTGVLFVNQNGKKANYDVESVANQIAAQIRLLQNEALNGKVVGAVNACKYEFNAPIGSVYTVKYYNNCAAPVIIGAGTQLVDLTKKRASFETNVNLYFSSPQGNVDSAKTIVVKSTLVPIVKNWVCVLANGSVTVQKTVCL